MAEPVVCWKIDPEHATCYPGNCGCLATSKALEDTLWRERMVTRGRDTFVSGMVRAKSLVRTCTGTLMEAHRRRRARRY